MRTAIDTNALSALWSKEPLASDIARNLGNAKREGGLVVSAPVYAELLAYPKATESFVNEFLADTGIAVDFEFSTAVMACGWPTLCSLCETTTTVCTPGSEAFAS